MLVRMVKPLTMQIAEILLFILIPEKATEPRPHTIISFVRKLQLGFKAKEVRSCCISVSSCWGANDNHERGHPVETGLRLSSPATPFSPRLTGWGFFQTKRRSGRVFCPGSDAAQNAQAHYYQSCRWAFRRRSARQTRQRYFGFLKDLRPQRALQPVEVTRWQRRGLPQPRSIRRGRACRIRSARPTRKLCTSGASPG